MTKEIPNFQQTRADLPSNATKAERLHAKANELRIAGDDLGGIRSAEGRRLLRRCRRIRMKARAVEQQARDA